MTPRNTAPLRKEVTMTANTHEGEEVTMDNNTTSEQESKGIRDFAEDLLSKGIEEVFRLGAGEKFPPPAGTTGDVPERSREEVLEGLKGLAEGDNIGFRIPKGHVSLDFDDYGDKQGWTHFEALLEAEGLGTNREDWVNTFVRQSRRGPDSPAGHMFFKLPPGWEDVRFGGKACEDVDLLQHHHRYAVAAGSVVEGEMYKFYRGAEETELLAVEDWPVLPTDIVSAFARSSRQGNRVKGDPESLTASLAWLKGRVFEGESRAELPDDVHRYDSMVSTVMSLVTNAVHFGHAGLMADLKEIKDRREAYEMAARNVISGDYAGAVTSAVAIVKAEIASDLNQDINWREKFGAEPLSDDCASPDYSERFAEHAEAYLAELIEEEQTAEKLEDRRAAAVAAAEASAPEDYWQTQPNLAKIAHYAERLSVDKYSLLFRVFAYLSAQMPPTTYLKGTKDQPLTIYSVVIAESGRGKGYLDELADTLVGEHLRGPEKQEVLRHGTGNIHTLLTELGDFQAEVKSQEDIPVPQRLLIQGNELASWAEMQGNLQWTGILADVFDGSGKYHVRNAGHKYSFKIDQHSLAVTFSVQPDAAHYLFDSTGRGLPGRCLISALPPVERTLPEDYDPFDLSVDYGINPFNIKEDTEPLRLKPAYMHNNTPFYLSAQAEQVNSNLKEAWDQEIGEYKRLRAEKIFSQMPKVRLRVAALLKVLLDLGEGHEVPLEALKMADFLLKVSVENTRYARALAEAEERRGNAAVAAVRKRADSDADLSLAKENVLNVIDKSKSGKAGLERINDRKKRTATDHPAAIAELVAEGVLEVVRTDDDRVSYRRR